jgi:hypothetical protein
MDAEKKAKRAATKQQAERRTEEVLAWRLAGAEFWDVRESVRDYEKEAGNVWTLPPGEEPLSDGQIRRYIQRADRMAAESTRATRKTRIRQHIAKRRFLYAKAVASGDIGKALAVADSECKLLDLFPKERNADLDLLIAAELARLAGQGQAGNVAATPGDANADQPKPASDTTTLDT